MHHRCTTYRQWMWMVPFGALMVLICLICIGGHWLFTGFGKGSVETLDPGGRESWRQLSHRSTSKILSIWSADEWIILSQVLSRRQFYRSKKTIRRPAPALARLCTLHLCSLLSISRRLRNVVDDITVIVCWLWFLISMSFFVRLLSTFKYAFVERNFWKRLLPNSNSCIFVPHRFQALKSAKLWALRCEVCVFSASSKT